MKPDDGNRIPPPGGEQPPDPERARALILRLARALARRAAVADHAAAERQRRGED